jgi:hypothetical protein
MNYYNFRMYYYGTTATVVRSSPSLSFPSSSSSCAYVRVFVVIHPCLSTLTSSSCWLVQDDDGNDDNAASEMPFVCDGGAAGHPILQNSPKVVIFIAGVPVIVIHLPHFCHCHHHLAGYSKMMMAMTTMSCHKSNHRRVVAASCCGCETHLVLFADQVPIVPWCFPSFFLY